MARASSFFVALLSEVRPPGPYEYYESGLDRSGLSRIPAHAEPCLTSFKGRTGDLSCLPPGIRKRSRPIAVGPCRIRAENASLRPRRFPPLHIAHFRVASAAAVRTGRCAIPVRRRSAYRSVSAGAALYARTRPEMASKACARGVLAAPARVILPHEGQSLRASMYSRARNIPSPALSGRAVLKGFGAWREVRLDLSDRPAQASHEPAGNERGPAGLRIRRLRHAVRRARGDRPPPRGRRTGCGSPVRVVANKAARIHLDADARRPLPRFLDPHRTGARLCIGPRALGGARPSIEVAATPTWSSMRSPTPAPACGS